MLQRLFEDGGIFDEIFAERERQIAKWGEEHQTHHHTSNRKWYWDAFEAYAKAACDARTQESISWEDIALEEFAEAMAEENWRERRKELIQLAAVVVAEIEDGDTKEELTILASAADLLGGVATVNHGASEQNAAS